VSGTDPDALVRTGYLLSLGTVPYREAEALQERLVLARQQDAIADTLILCEHPPVITLGRRADPAHILAPADVLCREGIAVCTTERGGDVTYHGPGQVVGYPIVHLHRLGLGASDYMHHLEDVVAEALADFGIATHRREGTIGVWVGSNKIAALGVRIKRGVAYHGWALNVHANMAHWATVLACGITDGGVTSMHLEMATPPTLKAVRERLVYRFAQRFGMALVRMDRATLEQEAAARTASADSTLLANERVYPQTVSGGN